MPAIRLPALSLWSMATLLVLPTLLHAAPQDTRRGQHDIQPGPVVQDVVLEGASAFSREDVLWLLGIRLGDQLPRPPADVAEMLHDEYRKAGYTAATVEAKYDEGARKLTLVVDEGRIDDIEITGLPERRIADVRQKLGVQPGDVFNSRRIRERLDAILSVAGGAWRLGEVELITRDGRRVLLIPIHSRSGTVRLRGGSEEREDFFSPVDGFAPSVALDITRFDPNRLRHTFVNGYVSYKFGREKPGYSAGFEQFLLERGRLLVGAETHDMTASDDLWRLSTAEQSMVALAFKNTFRDYYRRRGTQVFAAVQPHDDHELVASMRWDRHEPLENETDFSFFRDDHPYRPNPAIGQADVRALVLAYTWDTGGLTDRSASAYTRHLVDDLFRGSRRQRPGARVDWTSEIAGHGLGGDVEFDRHILNARAYVPVGARQSVAARMLLGFSGGTLPLERELALGGIGSVRGYAFKEARGQRATLFNAEYRLDLLGRWSDTQVGVLRLLLFFDAGRIHDPIGGSRTDWLRGTGFGVQTGPVRVEFGYRADDIPSSRQILVRLGPTF